MVISVLERHMPLVTRQRVVFSLRRCLYVKKAYLSAHVSVGSPKHVAVGPLCYVPSSQGPLFSGGEVGLVETCRASHAGLREIADVELRLALQEHFILRLYPLLV